jgi:hypothetical protein
MSLKSLVTVFFVKIMILNFEQGFKKLQTELICIKWLH